MIVSLHSLADLDSHSTDRTDAPEAMDSSAVNNRRHQDRPQQGNHRNNPRQQPQQPQKQHIPSNTKAPAATEAEDEKRTKDMLNNIWNQLKVNANASNPGITFPSSASAIAPQGLDLTETLKKCLKIAPSEGSKEQSPSGYATKMEVPGPVPAPAQLPPPPANWRIEAQIQHLNHVRSPAPVHPPNVNVHPRPFMGSSGGPPPRMQQQLIRHPPPPMFQQQMGMMQVPHMGFPQHGGRVPFVPHGQVVMPAFRPVAAVPFTHSAGPMPFMHPGGDGQFNHRQFHPNQHHSRNNNNQGTHRQEDSRLSGPHTLRNTVSTSGHGAFIPLQAARKITKLKNMNGTGQQQERVVAEESQAGGAAVVAAAKKSTVQAEQTNKTTKEKQPKKAPVAKSKANAAPRPPRIAANFSAKE